MDRSTILPLGPRLLIRPDVTPQEVRGIALPERVERRPESGEVIAVSLDLLEQFRVGERVAFAPYSGITVQVAGKPLKILSATEVLGTFGEEGAVAAPA